MQRNYCMFLDNKWYTLRLKIYVISQISKDQTQAAKIDAAILQDYLLDPVLGIKDPGTDEGLNFVGGTNSTTELIKTYK